MKKLFSKRILCFSVAIILVLLCGCGKSSNTLPSIETARIGTMVGSVNELLAQKKYPKASVERYNNYVDESAALMSDKIDYAMIDYAAAWLYTRNNKALCTLPGTLTDDVSSMALNKKNTELNKKINKILNQFLKDGTIKKMRSHWFREDGSAYQIVNVPKLTKGPVLKVAVTTLSEPLCFIRDGKMVGMDVELMDSIAYKLGMRVEYQDMQFAAMIDSLQSGKSDVIASIYNTPERAKRVDFTAGYFSNPQVLLVKKARAGKLAGGADGTITSNKQLNGKRVGFITGMIHIDVFRPKYKAQEFEFSNFSAMLAALKADKIDAMLVAQGKVESIIKDNPDLSALPPYAYTHATIGVNKNNTKLGDKVDGVIKAILKDGTFNKLQNKWLKGPESKKLLPHYTLNGKNGTLVTGVLGDDYPYSYYKNNQLVGEEVELSRLIASRLGMKLKITVEDFSAIIPSIASGKIDIAFNLSYSAERAKSIRFLTFMTADAATAMVRNMSYRANLSGGSAFTAFFSSLRDSFIRTFVVEDRYKLILQGLWTTIIISLLSLLFGSLLGALVCAMRRSRIRLLYGIATFYIRLIQGIPIVLILMILYYILFANVDIDPVLVAIIGFSINFAAYSAEIFRTAIEATDKGQVEAACALGFSKKASFMKVTLPQALRHIIPIFRGEFISMVKMTSVVGYIAIQDLTKMSDIIRSRTFDAFFPLFATAAIYFVITYLFVFMLGRIELSIDPKRRKRVVKGITQPAGTETEV